MKKLIVMSQDALVSEDVEYLSTLPNFRKYLAGGVGIERVRSIYPNITYPCHTTMITGVYPDKHGVVNNFELHPGQCKGLPWRWDYRFNEWKEDVFTRAKEAGYRTASAFWPVTGNHPAIDSLLAEYWPQFPGDTMRDAFSRMGSDSEMLDILDQNFGGKVPGHPELDRILVNCACDILKKKNPDILFLHPANVDWARHSYGVFNDQVTKGVEETDRYIGRIMETVREMGCLEETNFVLTSDHGQRNVSRILNPNVGLREGGFLKVGKDGKLKAWDAWCLSCGMSALVYLKDPKDLNLNRKVRERLLWMKEQKKYGIADVFTVEETEKKEHLSGGFSFVLEAEEGCAFGDRYQEPLEEAHKNSDYRYGRATHGYLPEKGSWPVFWAKGPDFRENVILKEAELVDIAPTLAGLLGTPLRFADGRCLSELLR